MEGLTGFGRIIWGKREKIPSKCKKFLVSKARQLKNENAYAIIKASK